MDGIFGIGPLELILIAILALIVLGPERLPGVMREGAKYIRQFRRFSNELTSQFSEELRALDEINPHKILNEMTDPNRPDPDEKPPAKAAPPAARTPPAGPAKVAAQAAQTTGANNAASTANTSSAKSASATNAADSGPANTILPPERTDAVVTSPSATQANAAPQTSAGPFVAPGEATSDGASGPDSAPEPDSASGSIGAPERPA